MATLVGNRAVVLGGSMAGLLAARVLSEYYSEVLVVDRDELLGETGIRRGVPQGFHAHALLARGLSEFCELFPGFTEEMSASGMPMMDMGEMKWSVGGLRLRNATTGLISVSLTRPVLERLVRQRVEGIANVKFRPGTDIIALTTTADRQRVTGARVAPHGAAGAATEEISADLVLDATGRGSRSAVWLEELGFDRPDEERVKIDLAYTTCEFLLPDRPCERDLSFIPLATPQFPRGAFFGRVRGDRHILSLTSMLGDHPTADVAGVREFAKSLPIPQVYDAIKDVEPDAGPIQFRYPASYRRHYEKLTRFPEGYLVVGDAVCSFNPVYAQGMTVAALEARTLGRYLDGGQPPPARLFFRDISKVIDGPWGIAAGGDLAWPGVEGERTTMSKVMNAYMGKLMYGMLHDKQITGAFMRVAGLMESPQSLLKPSMILRVMRNARKPLPIGQTGDQPAGASAGHART